MRFCNFLDFESKGLNRERQLSLILQAAQQAKGRTRSERETQELEYIYQDCQAALASLPDLTPEAERWLDRRIKRMTRVLSFYEKGLVRLNRRYWWIFFAVGLALLALAILWGTPSDTSLVEAATTAVTALHRWPLQIILG